MSRRVNPVWTLHQLVRPRPATDVCEFCNLALPITHRHLLESADGKIVCVCDACGLRFENSIGRWKLIPRDSRPLSDFHLTDAEWQSFGVPIALAFFFFRSDGQRVVAMYPSPGGPTESNVPAGNWENVVAQNPELGEMKPDVEALLVNRLQDRPEYFLTPIDRCYELTGLIRLHWRGFSGGDKVWKEVAQFFARLRESGGGNFQPAAEVGRA